MSTRRKHKQMRPAPVKSGVAAILCTALVLIVASDIPTGKATKAESSEAQTVNYVTQSPSQGSRP